MLGTPLKDNATKIMLLGCGELGKEFVIEAQRFGIQIVAADRYADAPAMQVAHSSHVVNMLDRNELARVIRREKPDFIVPEIEAIDTEYLLQLEKDGYKVIPTAKAVNLTMNREGIRRLAAEDVGLPTAKYLFAESLDEFKSAVIKIGLPCVAKPIMSSSGKGQSVVKTMADIEASWNYAVEGARGLGDKVIIEEFIDFDYEITLLTVRHSEGTSFCPPIGHIQIDGDYHESWQPMPMADIPLEEAQRQAKAITDELGGYGIFGVELFIKGDKVFFSEVSPRPHDTGMVTMVSQNMSEFELHVRAVLGLPVGEIKLLAPSASHVVLAAGSGEVAFDGLKEALSVPDTKIRLFGKPETRPGRRMGVALATGENTDDAREKAKQSAHSLMIVPN